MQITKLSLIFSCTLLVLLSSCATRSLQYRPTYYKINVQRGETLAQIAARFDTNWQQIVRDNKLSGPESIRPGMELKVRPGPGGFVAGTEIPSQMEGSTKQTDSSVKPGIFSRIFGFGNHRDSGQGEGKSPKKGLLFGGSASHGTFSWPLRGKLTSVFGKRRGRWHTGLDIGAPRGTKIRAAATGVVAFAGRAGGYGKTIILNHGDYRSLYAHLDDYGVSRGDVVRRGSLIGDVGQTGHATGPHLHFEIRNTENLALNPLRYLPSLESGALISSL